MKNHNKILTILIMIISLSGCDTMNSINQHLPCIDSCQTGTNF